MRYSGITCPVCSEVFTDADDVVVCPVCGTPHHRECWKKENRCANDALHAENFEWKFPEGKDPVEILNREAKEKSKKTERPEFAFKNGEGVKICPRCQGMNYENDAFCMRCHAPLNEDMVKEAEMTAEQNMDAQPQQPGQIPPTMNEEQRWAQGYQMRDPRQMAIENQMRFGGLEPNILVGGIPVGEMSDYISGKNPGRIIRRYASSERFGSKFTLSFAAVILGPVYLFYRKLYKAGAAVIAMLAVISLISTFLIMTPDFIEMEKSIFEVTLKLTTGEITQQEYTDTINELNEKYSSIVPSKADNARRIAADLLRYANYFIYFGCGLMFDKLYLKKIKKDVDEARAENDNMQSYRMSLMKKGGTSAGGAIIAVLLMFISTIATELPILFAVFGG